MLKLGGYRSQKIQSSHLNSPKYLVSTVQATTVKMVYKLAVMFLLICCCAVLNAHGLPRDSTCGRNGGVNPCPSFMAMKREQPEHAASIDDSSPESMKERNKAATDFLKLKRKLYNTEE